MHSTAHTAIKASAILLAVLAGLLAIAFLTGWAHTYSGANAGIVIGTCQHNIGYQWTGGTGFFHDVC